MSTDADRYETQPLERPTRQPESAPAGRRYAHPLVGFVAVFLGLAMGLALLYGLLVGSQRLYADRMLPNTYVLGIDISGLTLEQAVAALEGAAAPAHQGVLLLDAGDRVYESRWHDAGLRYDPQATAQTAFRVGHEPADLDPRRWIRVLRARHDIPPAYRLDAEMSRQMLSLAAPALAVAPGPSSLSLEDGRVTVHSGAPGRTLDVEATLANLATQAGRGDLVPPVAMVFTPQEAPALDTGPIQSQVNALLAPQIVIESYDLVQDRWYQWQLGPNEMATWIRLRRSDDRPDDPAAVEAFLAEEAVESTVERLSQELPPGYRLRPHEAVPALLQAHAAGGGTVTLYLSHDPGEYTVQAGDTGEKIAGHHGMPLWTLQQANPGTDLDVLRVGQTLVIPSQDVLTPLMPVPHKRIVISVSQRRLRAYEHGQLIWDWLVAVGRDSSPTHPGIYQVLDREEEAYASLWDLHMPHFVSVYEAGPGFYNGIHGLPLLSSGYRLWEGALGTDASYGCIVLGLAEAEQLCHWAEPGVPVIIEP